MAPASFAQLEETGITEDDATQLTVQLAADAAYALDPRNALTVQCHGVQAGSFATAPGVLPLDEWLCVRYDFPIGNAVPASQFRVRVNSCDSIAQLREIVDEFFIAPADAARDATVVMTVP